MQTDLTKLIKKTDIIAVAVSGGADSMALLHYMYNAKKNSSFKVIALNVEHGIRGETSLRDTAFVKEYCAKYDIPLLCYQVNCLKKAQEEKMSIEESARRLRYECFYDAINKGKCNKVATAHHQSDNVESVLFNLFRGTGLKGVLGIRENFEDKIIRPFIGVSKEEILSYVKENSIPYVTDETNLDSDYTRNFIRLQVLPKIKEVFPEAERSIGRFSKITKQEDEFMHEEALKSVVFSKNTAQLKLPLHNAILSRAVIIALKGLGLEKDWEKVNVDDVCTLKTAENGTKINLKKNLIAIKEYDKLVIYENTNFSQEEIPFSVGTHQINGNTVKISFTDSTENLRNGLKADADKIPQNAVIRFKRDGDRFTKFGGGTKSLSDYLTDKKIPLRLRNSIPLITDGNDVLVIFGVTISDKIKVDHTTKKIVEFSVT